MAKTKEVSLLHDEKIISKIYLIREQKVMLDRDLAVLYGINTKVLKQAVRRNIERFPEDFMFEMTTEELADWRSQFVTSNANQDKKGLRHLPFCFTEHGVLMLSSVLNSQQAVQANIQIMRIYTRIREMLMANKDIFLRLEQVEKQMNKHDQKIELLFTYLSKFIEEKEKPRIPIGFKRSRE